MSCKYTCLKGNALPLCLHSDRGRKLPGSVGSLIWGASLLDPECSAEFRMFACLPKLDFNKTWPRLVRRYPGKKSLVVKQNGNYPKHYWG